MSRSWLGLQNWPLDYGRRARKLRENEQNHGTWRRMYSPRISSAETDVTQTLNPGHMNDLDLANPSGSIFSVSRTKIRPCGGGGVATFSDVLPDLGSSPRSCSACYLHPLNSMNSCICDFRSYFKNYDSSMLIPCPNILVPCQRPSG